MSSGGDVVQYVPMLCEHFKTVGAPVMIGEWVYAGTYQPLCSTRKFLVYGTYSLLYHG